MLQLQALEVEEMGLLAPDFQRAADLAGPNLPTNRRDPEIPQFTGPCSALSCRHG